MTEALKCPSCSAPLDPPPNNAPSMRCPYCNTTVILRGDTTTTNAFTSHDVAGAFGPAVGKTLQLAEIAALLRAGKKIEAIKLYRQLHGSDLAAAKDAVERIEAGTFTSAGMSGGMSPAVRPAANAASAGAKFGLGLAAVIFVFVVILISVILRSVQRQIVTHTAPAITPPTIVIPRISIPTAPPPPPQFAEMTLQFGSEGIGAGQFKDSRAVAVDTSSGKIYVAEYSDGRVQIFDPDGKFLSEFTLGKDKYVMNLACDHQGNLYICMAGSIVRYDAATHTPQTQFQQTTDETAYSPEEYMDVCVALNGNIYSVSGSHIIVLNSKGEIQNIYKEADKIGEDVEFQRIAVSGEGDIYCFDQYKGIFKFSSDGRYVNRFGGGEGMGPGFVSTGHSIAVDGQGRVFVGCSTPSSIQVFDSNGRYIDGFGGNEVCFGLAIDDQNNIYGCFRNKYCVRKFAINKQKPTH